MFGVGWWVRSITILRPCIEKLAKAAFSINKDPLDAAIFYLAMKKKAVLWGLFRFVIFIEYLAFLPSKPPKMKPK